MAAEPKAETPTSEGGVTQSFEDDFKKVARELDKKLWPAWAREEGAEPQEEKPPTQGEQPTPGLTISVTVPQPG